VSGYTLEQFQFETPEEADTFRELLTELRCVVCQNETLAGSQADVAQIMREEVYRLFREGNDEEQVKAHLVERYTDFVLYDPPLKPTTYLLWFGPFVLIAIGSFFLLRTLQSKKRTADRDLSEEERQRLHKLLADAEQEDKA
jgi:cytochrome c-type biogenesis protein CcmH